MYDANALDGSVVYEPLSHIDSCLLFKLEPEQTQIHISIWVPILSELFGSMLQPIGNFPDTFWCLYLGVPRRSSNVWSHISFLRQKHGTIALVHCCEHRPYLIAVRQCEYRLPLHPKRPRVREADSILLAKKAQQLADGRIVRSGGSPLSPELFGGA